MDVIQSADSNDFVSNSNMDNEDGKRSGRPIVENIVKFFFKTQNIFSFRITNS